MDLITVPITPHALTADTLPAEGELIGYTGLAYYGEDFGTHVPVSGPIRVGERTGGFAPGFYAECIPSGEEIFVLFDDDAIRQTLHGYVIGSELAEHRRIQRVAAASMAAQGYPVTCQGREYR